MYTKHIVSVTRSVVHNWEALMQDSELCAEDAYWRLSETELRELARLARIHWLLETGRDSPDGVSAQEAVRIVRAFAGRGWDEEWFLSQREAVSQHRIKRSFNPAVEGRQADLVGLVLLLDWNEQGRFTRFLLTPELGKCSHEPPPPHNQVVYIESPSPVKVVPRDVAGNIGLLCLSVFGSILSAAFNHRQTTTHKKRR